MLPWVPLDVHLQLHRPHSWVEVEEPCLEVGRSSDNGTERGEEEEERGDRAREGKERGDRAGEGKERGDGQERGRKEVMGRRGEGER